MVGPEFGHHLRENDQAVAAPQFGVGLEDVALDDPDVELLLRSREPDLVGELLSEFDDVDGVSAARERQRIAPGARADVQDPAAGRVPFRSSERRDPGVRFSPEQRRLARLDPVVVRLFDRHAFGVDVVAERSGGGGSVRDGDRRSLGTVESLAEKTLKNASQVGPLIVAEPASDLREDPRALVGVFVEESRDRRQGDGALGDDLQVQPLDEAFAHRVPGHCRMIHTPPPSFPPWCELPSDSENSRAITAQESG